MTTKRRDGGEMVNLHQLRQEQEGKHRFFFQEMKLFWKVCVVWVAWEGSMLLRMPKEGPRRAPSVWPVDGWEAVCLRDQAMFAGSR